MFFFFFFYQLLFNAVSVFFLFFFAVYSFWGGLVNKEYYVPCTHFTEVWHISGCPLILKEVQRF